MNAISRPSKFLNCIRLLAFLAGLQLCGASAQVAIVIDLDTSPLIIVTSSGDIIYDLEVADTEAERAAGLMFRTNFPKNRAMLFDFGQTRMVSMWMKNTPVSLDMVFVDKSGLVVGIATNTQPQSLDVISSPAPVRFVVELNAGEAAEHNLKSGDKMNHPIFER